MYIKNQWKQSSGFWIWNWVFLRNFWVYSPVDGLLTQAWHPLWVEILLSILKLTWKLSFFTVAADRLRPTDLNWILDYFTRKCELLFPLDFAYNFSFDLNATFFGGVILELKIYALYPFYQSPSYTSYPLVYNSPWPDLKSSMYCPL